MRTIVIGVAAVVCALAAGYSLGTRGSGRAPARPLVIESRSVPAEPIPAAGTPSTCSATVDGAAVRAEIRQAIHEELAKSAATTAPPRQEPSAADTPPTDEAIAALDRGHRLLADARAARHWGPEQAAELRQLLTVVDRESKDELLRTLVQALNAQQIKADGPPL